MHRPARVLAWLKLTNLWLIPLALAACAAEPEEGRAIYFENATVCAEAKPVANRDGWPLPTGLPGDLPPLTLLEQAGFLTCRAYQTGRIGQEAYLRALLDSGETLLRSEATRAQALLRIETLGQEGWVARSTNLHAACLGLTTLPDVDASAALFCLQHFPQGAGPLAGG
ncbi:MAG: hypothetical protein Kilf2KO_26260 [Rhodospirillales bacterium]